MSNDPDNGGRQDPPAYRVYGGGHDASTYHSPEAWATTLDFLDTRLDTGFKGPFLPVSSIGGGR